MARVERDLNYQTIMELQAPHHMQGHQPPHLILGQAAQVPIQPGLEHFQGGGIHNLSGRPDPAPNIHQIHKYICTGWRNNYYMPVDQKMSLRHGLGMLPLKQIHKI